jgi:hypothetical protein
MTPVVRVDSARIEFFRAVEEYLRETANVVTRNEFSLRHSAALLFSSDGHAATNAPVAQPWRDPAAQNGLAVIVSVAVAR